MTKAADGARSVLTVGLGGVLVKLKQRFCSHRFAMEDLTMVNRDSEGNDRVSWACDKCGKVFRAQCGLDISPEHGPIFRRKTTPNDRVQAGEASPAATG